MASLGGSLRATGRVIFVRHGESIWNTSPVRFTGWANVPLTDKGMQQAQETGKTLAMFNLRPDTAITSLLRRSKDSLEQIFKANPTLSSECTVINSWRMNERHYGALVGLSKEEAAEQMGKELVNEWRKSWAVSPPPMLREDLYAYKEAPWAQPVTVVTEPGKESFTVTESSGAEMPVTESLEDCCNRVLPLWTSSILPRLLLGQCVLIVAHANSIRAIVKHIDEISTDRVRTINVPSAIPLVYDFARQDKLLVPVGAPSSHGMRGRYVASRDLVLSLRQSLRTGGDNENDTSFLSLLDESVLSALSVDSRSHLDSKGGVVVGGPKSSVLVRAHFARNVLGDLEESGSNNNLVGEKRV